MRASLILKFVILLLSCLQAIPSQARKVKFNASLELSSAYLWRGSRECGFHLAPKVSLTAGGFTAETFGYFSLDGKYRELDIDLSYKIGAFTLHLADYYAPPAATPFFSKNFFNMRKGETSHIQEAILCYEPEKLPLALKWFTFLHGDWIPLPDGSPGKPSFSSYLELELFYRPDSFSRLSFFTGASVLKGSYTGYTKDFAVIHLELRYSRSIEAGPVHIPLSISCLFNPYSGACWMNAGIGVSF